MKGTEVYDKFVDRFHDLWKVQKKCFGENDAVTVTMIYLKVLHDMVSQNFKSIFQK